MKSIKINEAFKFTEINDLPLEVKKELNIDGMIFELLEGEGLEEPLFSATMNEFLSGRVCDLEKVFDVVYEEKNQQQDIDNFVVTNIGKVPIEDYREIVANQHGFDSYEEMYREGFRIGNGYDKEPEPVVPAWEQKKELSQNLQNPAIDDLIASATAISEQAKELSQNLQKHKDSIEFEH